LAVVQENPSGIVLFAKHSGLTSFSSLWTIKNSLHTKKVGHTGTLDSFADGLLVVMVGKMTKLVSHITAFDKEYEAIIVFGQETDTLDPTGTIVLEKTLPRYKDLVNVLDSFKGNLMQQPPLYSALHIDGKRASEIAREGGFVEMDFRPITIFDLELKDVLLQDDKVVLAHIRVHCSKGTYIRSLARDIAKALGSCGYVGALRRTKVGKFELTKSDGSHLLPDFSLSNYNITEKKLNCSEKNPQLETVALHSLSFEMANDCGFKPVILKKEFYDDFFHGRFITKNFFENSVKNELGCGEPEKKSLAVFSSEEQFLGLVSVIGKKYSYDFVIPKR